ncbi:GntR family transcriptional regulator [Pseudonocardia sp. GCM10023141]|uniref:GntR family transcriptional regulator n=1 Tax=Pseudonocardia sp. GCM10023141 TaxID=3252653 RepID=UPI003609A439
MVRTATAESLGADVYAGIRSAILNGDFQPGQRLKALELRGRFGGVSLSVVREALSRLAAERLVVARYNQGFTVAEVTAKGIVDLTSIRCLIEGHALRLSIERGDFEWESAVVAAHHVLRRTPRRSPGAGGTPEAWAIAHRVFHKALIGACDIPDLLDICNSLMNGSELYRRVAARVSDGTRDVDQEHENLMALAVARKTDEALAAFESHLQCTASQVLTGLELDRNGVGSD